jgi:hypothetical protein
LGYARAVSGFFSTLGQELGARRRRLREAMGGWGQALCEFLVMAGLLIGSAGLYLRPWMAPAAPWGFALPFVFLAGFFGIEVMRQRAVRRGAASETLATSYDWLVLIWSLGCALAGAAAFVIAWGAEPVPLPEPPPWEPPESSVSVDISP